MKKYFTIILTVSIVLSLHGIATAIDKSIKETKPAVDKKAVQNNNIKNKANQDSIGPKKNNNKSFDSFIDKNSNGIDDRAEKKTATKTNKNDSTKTEKKINNP